MKARAFASVFIIFLGLNVPAEAGIIVDAANDFIGTYTGPKNPDLDVTAVEATFDGADFTLKAWLAGNVGTTPGVSYVWGVDRGQGTARFASIGVGGVLFDSIVALSNTGTGSVNRIVGGGSSVIAPTDIVISGNFISAKVKGTFLPSLGFALGDYTFNLWPRSGAGNPAISDFAPDNSNFKATAVPEPATLASAALATFVGGILVRRKRTR